MKESLEKRGKTLGYPADLLTPIAMDDPKNYIAPIMEAVGVSNSGDWYGQESARKFFLLLEHYKLDRRSSNCFHELAMRLFIDWVPGFRLVEKAETRGRKTNDEETIFVAKEIEKLLKKRKGMTVTAACIEFKKNQRKDSPIKHQNVRTLERKYKRGRVLLMYQNFFLDRENLFINQLFKD